MSRICSLLLAQLRLVGSRYPVVHHAWLRCSILELHDSGTARMPLLWEVGSFPSLTRVDLFNSSSVDGQIADEGGEWPSECSEV
jgi:hypothetical protein